MKTRVDAEIKAGRLWRGREILGGVIQYRIYDPDLFEELGYVLLLMNDLPEAGKYLFLSGKRKPEYEEAIALFLPRHGRHCWHQLVSQFPRRNRFLRLDQYPPLVQDELRALGIPPERGEKLPAYARPAATRDKITTALASLGCIFAFIVIGGISLTGLVTVMGFL